MKSSLKLFNLVLIAGALCSTGLRAQTIGGAAPQAKPKKFTFGVGYAYNNGQFEETSSRFDIAGTSTPTGMLDDRIEILQRRIYLEGGYAFGSNFEMVARLGLNYADPEGVSNNFKNATMGGLTFRWRFMDGEKMDMGLVLHGNFSARVDRHDTYVATATNTSTTPVTNYQYTYSVDTAVEGLRDGMLAVPFEFKAGERGLFYFAPAYVRQAGRAHDVLNTTTTTTQGTTTTITYAVPVEYRAHITRKQDFGGYTGFRFGDQDWQFNVEGAYANGMTLSFGFRRAF